MKDSNILWAIYFTSALVISVISAYFGADFIQTFQNIFLSIILMSILQLKD